jgi:hypothetical protein
MTSRPPGFRTYWDIERAMLSRRFNFSTEKDLQTGVAVALTDFGIPFEREVVLSPKDRIDFLLPGGLGLEVKLEGSISALTRQLHRYAQLEAITELAIVVTRTRLLNLPLEIGGKRLHRILVMRAFA